MIAKNNPLNIRSGAFTWKGQVGNTKGFCVFDDVSSCVRAWLYLVFISYPKVLGNGYTLRSFIDRYCPDGDGSNNPSAYLRFLLNNGNFHANCQVQSLSYTRLFQLCVLMCKLESGYHLSSFSFDLGYKKYED